MLKTSPIRIDKRDLPAAMSDAWYEEAFSEYVTRCDEKVQAAACLKKWVGQDTWVPCHGILSVGSGPGDADLSCLGTLPLDARHTHVVCLEPNPRHNKALQANLSQFAGVKSVHAIAERFETVDLGNAAFDFILLSHVIYYIPDKQRLMAKLMRHLSPTGVIVCMVNARRGLGEIYQYYLACSQQDCAAPLFLAEATHALFAAAGLHCTTHLIKARLELTAARESAAGYDKLLSIFINADARTLAAKYKAEIWKVIDGMQEQDAQGVFLPQDIAMVVAKRALDAPHDGAA